MGQKKLTSRQEEILRFVLQELEEKGFPPSVREIGKAVGLSSSSTVHSHLRNLEKKGLIRRHPAKPRTIEILTNKDKRKHANHIPILANPLRTMPLLAPENIIRYYPVDEEWGKLETLFIIKNLGAFPDAKIETGDYLVATTDTETIPGNVGVSLEGQQFRISSINGNNNSITGKIIGVIRSFSPVQ